MVTWGKTPAIEDANLWILKFAQSARLLYPFKDGKLVIEMTSVSTSAVQGFISGVASLYATGRAREHAYRPLLERLFASFHDVLPINDPARSAHGNPDFVFLRNSNRDITIGYGEAKDLGVDLDRELERSGPSLPRELRVAFSSSRDLLYRNARENKICQCSCKCDGASGATNSS